MSYASAFELPLCVTLIVYVTVSHASTVVGDTFLVMFNNGSTISTGVLIVVFKEL
jgi:hypothetical protein